jgi:UDP-2,3-diacylglucosamine pyrophosphatase LpxH
MKRLLRYTMLCGLAASVVNAASNRLLVLISDTHFGVGRDANGAWNPMEDARWATEFDAFLKEVDRQGKGATDLVVNGDMFELWQSVKADCIYPNAVFPDRNLGCSEKDAVARLQRALKDHGPEMRSLGEFAASGDNRLIIVPGNHDAVLLFPKVAKTLLARIGAPAERASVQAQGYWISPDQQIYAEHGHQIGEELNRFDGWPQPFLTVKKTQYIQRPWGEQMVQQFYNDYEKKYPVIDNFTDDSIGLGYGFAAEGKAGSFAGGARFFRMALFQVSLQQFARSLGGEAGTHEWDVDKEALKGGRFLVESIPQDDPARALAEGALAGADLGGMTPDEMRDICDHRQELATAGRPVQPCATATAGAAAEKMFRSAKAVMTKHLTETYGRLRASGASTQPFQLFVYSHTHYANAGFQPFAGSGSSWNPWVANTGAWQRIVSKEQFEKVMASRKLSVNDALKAIQPEDLPACYDALVVPPYKSDPDFQLKGWQMVDGKWTLGGKCR